MNDTVAANIARDAREKCARKLNDIAAGWRKAIGEDAQGMNYLVARAHEADFYAGLLRQITDAELLSPRKISE